MAYKIEEKKEFKIAGLSINTSVQKALEDCPKLWEEFLERRKEINNGIGEANYGVCFKMEKGSCNFKYIACCEISDFNDIPVEMVLADVEGSKYAIFTHKGKASELGKTYEKIDEAIKKDGLKQKNFWVEFYDSRWRNGSEKSEMEIWCAIE